MLRRGRRQLAGIGERAVAEGLGVAEFHETTRDTHDFGRRIGQLPEQRQGDGKYDYRSLLHRDGSVLSAVTLQDLANPDLLYRALGCKLAVGMPFKDLATSDAIFLRDVPPADDFEARRALSRLAVRLLRPLFCPRSSPSNPSPLFSHPWCTRCFVIHPADPPHIHETRHPYLSNARKCTTRTLCSTAERPRLVHPPP